MIAGNAASCIYVAIVSPEILVPYYHFQGRLMFFCIPLFLAWIVFQSGARSLATIAKSSLQVFPLHLVFGLVTLSIVISSIDRQLLKANTVMQDRNEYGILTVTNFEKIRTLTNGRTLHGSQSNDLSAPLTPTAYYSASGGLGKSIEFLHSPENIAPNKNVKMAAIGVGVGVGVGVGTVCAWLKESDTIHFYEINPLVLDVAETNFSYLDQCKGTYEVTLGDARLQLQYLAKSKDKVVYDLIIAGAFSSDSIPMHLLTIEAFEIYKNSLAENGILAIHTSNRFMRLENLVKRMAQEIGMEALLVIDKQDRRAVATSSSWVLVTKNEAVLKQIPEKVLNGQWPDERFTAYWTDDFSSIISVIN
mgnify:CR=1 FL=1